MGTFCKRLWDRVYVDQYGEVYACCKYQPDKLGNLYEKEFMEIWNGPKMQQYRKNSIEGTLHCFEGCTLLSPEEKKNNVVRKTGLTVEERDLKKVRLMFGEGCNIACIMCKQDHRDRLALTEAVWKDKIPYHAVKVVEFQGGEPLFITEGRNCYRYLTETLGKKVNVITNGLLINEEWAELLVKGSDYLILSINGASKRTHEIVNQGSNWEKVMANIGRLVEAKARHGSKIELVGHMTLVVENIREIPDFITLAQQIRLDTVEFGYDQPTVPPWLGANPEVKRTLIERIKRVREEVPMNVDQNRLVHLGLVERASPAVTAGLSS
ncbi:MAG: radical SAM protein [Candidatus Manganitrophus sp. SB1]|nr:radical SAM protein [Candidatus Manganitrophus morganii]